MIAIHIYIFAALEDQIRDDIFISGNIRTRQSMLDQKNTKLINLIQNEPKITIFFVALITIIKLGLTNTTSTCKKKHVFTISFYSEFQGFRS
jgi:hypothetical protein